MRNAALPILFLAVGSLAGAQDGPKKKEIFAKSEKHGLSIQVPVTPKDQLWEAKADTGKFYKDSGVLAQHIIDTVSVEVVANYLAPNTKWPDGGVKEIARNARDNFTKPQGEQKEANFKECRTIETNEKYKHPSQAMGGSCVMHKLKLINQQDREVPIMQIFVLSGQALFITTVLWDKDETYKKYERDILMIMGSIRKFAPKKE